MFCLFFCVALYSPLTSAVFLSYLRLPPRLLSLTPPTPIAVLLPELISFISATDTYFLTPLQQVAYLPLTQLSSVLPSVAFLNAGTTVNCFIPPSLFQASPNIAVLHAVPSHFLPVLHTAPCQILSVLYAFHLSFFHCILR